MKQAPDAKPKEAENKKKKREKDNLKKSNKKKNKPEEVKPVRAVSFFRVLFCVEGVGPRKRERFLKKWQSRRQRAAVKGTT